MNKQVPKNWEEHILDNIANINYGTRIVKNTAVGNKYYVYGGGGKTFLTNEYNRENTLVVARFGMSPKCTRFIEGKFFLNDSGLTVETKNENVLNQKFLNWQIYFLNDYIYSLGKGVAQKNLNVQLFKKSKIFVPASIIEQQEIVQVLDTMSDIIRLREECISHAQALIPALFQEMFKAYEKNIIQLSNICDIKGGKRLPQGEKLIDTKTNHPYIRVTNFKNQSIDMSDIKYITENIFQKISRYIITTNDIYISIAGTIGLVGEIPKELNNANLTENAAKLILKDNNVNKKYLIYCLNSPYLQQQIREATVGVGVPKLALARIGALKVYLPPIELQEQFAQKVIEIETYIKEQQGELKNAKQMFQSLLHHAFTGKLTKHKYGEINE